MILITDYQQYREFLKDFYLLQKQKKTGLTYARFSSAAGLKSPNYLKLVMDGQKNLTAENTIRFAKALKLGENETEYFEALVQLNQAKKPLEREYYEQRLKRVKNRLLNGGAQERTLEEYEFESISNWLHYAVMVLTNVKGFRESPAWIRERLYNVASESEIASVLEKLITVRLLARNESGRLIQTQRQVKTKPELRRQAIKTYYEGLLGRAIQAIRITPAEEREFGSCVVGLSPSQVPELKRRVRDFMKSLNEWALENPRPDQVYGFTFAGFPISAPESRISQ